MFTNTSATETQEYLVSFLNIFYLYILLFYLKKLSQVETR